MKIINKKIKELIPYINNPRRNEHAVNAVASSIAEFGFKVPVVIDKDNIVITGHTRIKAAEKLGLKEIPCIIADDLTPEQVKAFRLADNRVSELADWDYTLLDAELRQITDDIDLESFGFSLDEIEVDPGFQGNSFELLESYGFDAEVPETNEFAVTFVFPKTEETTVRKYIKEKGKKELTEMIINKCREVEDVG